MKRESVNRGLTVLPRHAPLTRGLNVKPRPFLGVSSQILRSPFYRVSIFVPNTVLGEKEREERADPPFPDRVKQTATTGSHLYRDNSCNFGGPRRDSRTCESSDCRRVVWLIAWRSFFARPRDLLREPVPLVLLLDRHRLALPSLVT